MQKHVISAMLEAVNVGYHYNNKSLPFSMKMRACPISICNIMECVEMAAIHRCKELYLYCWLKIGQAKVGSFLL